MKPITDTGHHLIDITMCDCGWHFNPMRPGTPAAQAQNHHRDVCAQLVRDNEWPRRWWLALMRLVAR